MTPSEAEVRVANFLHGANSFVSLFKKGIDGNQPFDLLAISKDVTLCLDVKLCDKDYFTFNRVEENQKNSFQFLNSLNNPSVHLGFAIVYKGIAYYLPYNRYVDALEQDKKSLKTKDMIYWGEI